MPQSIWKSQKWLMLGATCIISLLIVILLIMLSVAPVNFPSHKIVTIKENTGLTQTAATLSDDGIIRSAFMYKAFVVLLGGSKRVMAGDYLFSQPQSSLRIAWRTIHGESELPKNKVTIPEGVNTYQIAAIIRKQIPDFDAATFIAKAKPYEGYLFPDTYFWAENVTPDAVISEMRNVFTARLQGASDDLNAARRPIDQVVTMASLLEEEGSDENSMKLIAGILWKRIDAGMPLQLDTTIYYALHKPYNQPLTVTDLATTSPYNTYKHKGLPPGPISNPGLQAILAAAYPESSPYWFFLADTKGVLHYASTLDGHVANERKYLQ